jgi:hypothetical protein
MDYRKIDKEYDKNSNSLQLNVREIKEDELQTSSSNALLGEEYKCSLTKAKKLGSKVT